MAVAEGKKLMRRSKMVYDGEGGLRRTEEPTYIRPTQDPAANLDPDVTANPYTQLDLDEGEREEYQFNPAMVNDIMGYPEDYDVPIVQGVEFNMEDLDVGKLQEFGPAAPEAYHHPDAAVPVTPPGNAHTPIYTAVPTGFDVGAGTNLSRTYGDHDVALYADRTYQSGGVSEERVMNISVKEALKSRGDEAKRVIKKELKQMLDKRVWTPVHVSSLSVTEKRSIIRSQIFLKEKYLPTGKFEKLKARLVAGGNQQDKDLYDDISSPTVSTSAVMTVFAVAAHENRKGSVMDIGGAFLNATMGKVIVHMRLDPTMSAMLGELDGMYGAYTDDRGCTVVRLEKALYGCVESAALWYNNLSASLTDAGFKINEYEICVYNKRDANGVQCTVAVHVDDLIITSESEEMIMDLKGFMKKRYGEITSADGPVLNYLGMVFDLSVRGQVKMTMQGYVEDVIAYSGIVGHSRSPATSGLFDTRDGAVLVSETQRSWFHSVVAKLAYLAKRARPECLTAVAFLATRVTKCTVDDVEKLKRLIHRVH